ncbi:MAG: tripartite tricarboxylate transporter substrate-binding protein [Betaproteobacteria bacterium]
MKRALTHCVEKRLFEIVMKCFGSFIPLGRFHRWGYFVTTFVLLGGLSSLSWGEIRDTQGTFPQKTIHIIVASAVGTADDFFARALGEELESYYAQRVIVDDRPGAGGLIGNRRVSRSKADGYTLGLIGVTRIISELMHENAPYNALGDIVGISHVASISNVLLMSRALPVSTAKDFVHYAKSHPGDLNFASLGYGSASHLAADIFSRILGIEAVHVPFKNLSDSYVEMVLGRVHYAIYTVPVALVHLRDSRLRALAVMTPRRSRHLPNVPAIAEMGLPEAQYDSWSGIVAPLNTPRRIVEQLNSDVLHVLQSQKLRVRFDLLGAEPVVDSTPEGFMRFMQEEYLRFQGILQDKSIKKNPKDLLP